MTFDLPLKLTSFNRFLDSTVSNHLAKTASKSVYSFGWFFSQIDRQTHTHTQRQTDRQTDRQTNSSEIITPLRFHGGVLDSKIRVTSIFDISFLDCMRKGHVRLFPPFNQITGHNRNLFARFTLHLQSTCNGQHLNCCLEYKSLLNQLAWH